MAKPKRRWGDRRDGRWVREVTGLQCIMSNLMPNRTDCEVCLQDKIDVFFAVGRLTDEQYTELDLLIREVYAA